jgi:hypothetical protein
LIIPSHISLLFPSQFNQSKIRQNPSFPFQPSFNPIQIQMYRGIVSSAALGGHGHAQSSPLLDSNPTASLYWAASAAPNSSSIPIPDAKSGGFYESNGGNGLYPGIPATNADYMKNVLAAAQWAEASTAAAAVGYMTWPCSFGHISRRRQPIQEGDMPFESHKCPLKIGFSNCFVILK